MALCRMSLYSQYRKSRPRVREFENNENREMRCVDTVGTCIDSSYTTRVNATNSWPHMSNIDVRNVVAGGLALARLCLLAVSNYPYCLKRLT